MRGDFRDAKTILGVLWLDRLRRVGDALTGAPGRTLGYEASPSRRDGRLDGRLGPASRAPR